MIAAPTLDGRYWFLLCLASVFGADTGDLCAHVLGLGHLRGLPFYAVLFALDLALARRTRGAAPYWIAVLIVRTAATNLADLQTHDLRLPTAPLLAGYAILLAALVALSRRRRDPAGPPVADSFFWAGMLVAGTLGTIAGDVTTRAAAGTAPSTALWSALLAATFLALPALRASPAAAFWLAVVAIRSWGTCAGDLLADRLGLVPDTLLSGLVFAAALAARPRRAPARTPVPPARRASPS